MNLLKITGLLFIVIYSSFSQAGTLCDSRCALSIDFPGGGSIEAVESLQIVFGDSGLVETPGTVTAYLEGDTISLNAGEIMLFDDGGHFNIGSSGIIDFSNFTITTDGTIRLTAIGGAETITIPAGHQLTINAGELIIGSTIIVDGELTIGDNSTIDIAVDGISTGCSIVNSTGSTLTIEGASQPINNDHFACQTLTAEISLVGGVSGQINSGTVTLAPTDLLEVNITAADPISLDAGSITPSQDNQSSPSNAGALDIRLLIFYLLISFLRKFTVSRNRGLRRIRSLPALFREPVR